MCYIWIAAKATQGKFTMFISGANVNPVLHVVGKVACNDMLRLYLCVVFSAMDTKLIVYVHIHCICVVGLEKHLPLFES